jgi:hypothetical protein
VQASKIPKTQYLAAVEKAMAEEKTKAPLPPIPPEIIVQHEPLTEAACRVIEVSLRLADILYHAEEETEEDAEYTLAILRGVLRQAGYPKKHGVSNDISHAKSFIQTSRNFRKTVPVNLANFYTAWANFVRNYRDFQKERERWITETNVKYQEWEQGEREEAARRLSGILGS